ncbi:dienelactone hydrolase family protein [Nonomuraea rhodomycinica]|uniref:Dienelactone hydrolase family protein n=1 Tax=Nonomuraea rhodomycinica TaxID=1712872 RepID=A0A7Y6ISS5_9ACTN|nr:dienelactone hydrolase family protein [Nonomuraea rhodomycinica]NUW43751.1 dienelactone hydrolase family protein [Nonomuraea rhodomycinica]
MDKRIDQVTAHDGSFDVHLWLPDRGSGPGILLVQEIYGVGPYITKVAEELAARGYVVAAPDLFWRLRPGWIGEHTPEGTAASIELASGFDLPQGVADCALTLVHLRDLPEVTGGLGALGFCLGGSVDYMLATQADLDAVLSFYGSAVPEATGLMERITSPLLLVFGGSDPYIPREQVAKVEEAAQGRPGVRVYVDEEAGHAFHNSEAPMFHHPEAARRAWSVALDFLDSHLPVS